MPKKKSRARRPNKSTASTASTTGSTTADGKLSVEWLEDSCGFEVKRKYKQGDALVQKVAPTSRRLPRLRVQRGRVPISRVRALPDAELLLAAVPEDGLAKLRSQAGMWHAEEDDRRGPAPQGTALPGDGCWSKRQIEDGRRAGDLRGRGGVQG